MRTILYHPPPESAIRVRFGTGYTYLPTGIRTAAVPYESIAASLQIHAMLIKPYEYIFRTLLYAFTYQP